MRDGFRLTRIAFCDKMDKSIAQESNSASYGREKGKELKNKMKKLCKVFAAFAFAAAAMVMVPNAADAAGVPSNLKQTSGTETSVSFKWDAVVNADEYYVSWSADGITWSDGQKTYGGPDKSIYNLSAGKSYYVKVCSVDENDTWSESDDIFSEWSAPFEVVTAPDEAEIKPVNFTSILSNSITASWSPATGATAYVIYNDDMVLGRSTETTCTVGGLVASTWYDYNIYPVRVSASGYEARYSCIHNYKRTAKDNSLINPGVSTTTPSVVVTAPGTASVLNFTVASASGTSGVASFTATDPQGKAAGYEVEVFKVKGGKKVKTISSATGVSTSVSLPKNTPLKYRIRYYTISNGQKLYGGYSGFKYFLLHKITGKRQYSLMGSACKIKMKWSKVKGAKGYTVYISERSDRGFKKVKSLGKNKKSITIKKIGKKKLSKYTRYYVKVVAKVKSGKKVLKNDAQSIQHTN